LEQKDFTRCLTQYFPVRSFQSFLIASLVDYRYCP